jgi:hypothetical protein
MFLYRTVLDRELGKIMPIRGRHGKRLPVVLTRREVPDDSIDAARRRQRPGRYSWRSRT